MVNPWNKPPVGTQANYVETGGPRRLEHVFGVMCKTVNFLRTRRFIAQTQEREWG